MILMNCQMKSPSGNKYIKMKKLKQYSAISLIILFSFLSLAQAQDIPDPMNPPRLVNDFASFLPQTEVNQLEGKLRQFNNQTSTQIYVVIIKDLKGYAPGDFAVRLGEKWGVGQKNKNNGIVILVKPKTSDSQGHVFISTGYGLEGVVPDAIANRIVNNEILPAFKTGNYYGGIDKAVNVLISLSKGECTAEDYHNKTDEQSSGGGIIGIVFMAIIFMSIFGGRGRMGRHSGVGRNLPFLLLLGMMNSGGRSHGGMFGDFSGGGGGFGGFGGGGGGSFGGGGAGGSW